MTATAPVNSLSPTHPTASSATVPADRPQGISDRGPDHELQLELRDGLEATCIDGHLRRASRGRDLTNRILAFYLDELHESGKFRDLGYRCLAQYADQRLGLDPRRARELHQAGRALLSLTRIDAACRDSRLSWTKTELLTHGVQEHEQDAWLERALRVGCSELRQMLLRHRRGLRVEKDRDGGLPGSEFAVQVTLRAAAHEKMEEIRRWLMTKRGVIVDDSEVVVMLLDGFELPARDAKDEINRAAAIEHDATPDWLRRKVLARDDHRCGACGTTAGLHVHHVRFRSQGGLTHEGNLATVCVACHGLIHEGRLFATGSAPAIGFRNRAGESLVSAAGAGAPARVVLRLLSRQAIEEDLVEAPEQKGGGQPPRLQSAATEEQIPEDITPEWFLQHMHQFEPGRDGVWRPVPRRRVQGTVTINAPVPTCPDPDRADHRPRSERWTR